LPTAALSARRLEATPGIEPGYADLQFCGLSWFHWIIPPHVASMARSGQQHADCLGNLGTIVTPVGTGAHSDPGS
jgi:hypothetical protein